MFFRTKAKGLHRIFDVRRILADDPTKLKGSCSEFLGLFGLLRHFVEVEVPSVPELALHKRSFGKLRSVLDLIMDAKRCLVSPAEVSGKLAVECSEYLRLHKDICLPHVLGGRSN